MKHILAIIMFTLLSASVSHAQTQDNPKLHCKAATKSGKPCQSVIVSKKTGYCNAHNPDRPHCKANNSKGQPCGMMPLKDAVYCRHHVSSK